MDVTKRAVWRLLSVVLVITGLGIVVTAKVSDLPSELVFDLEDAIHEPLPVVKIRSGDEHEIPDSALVEIDSHMGAPCAAGTQCVITDGVCCPGGRFCCPNRCVNNGGKMTCTPTDSQLAQRALLLVNKRKNLIDQDERSNTNHDEKKEKEQYTAWLHKKMKRKWKAELRAEKKAQELRLAKKEKKLMKKLKYIAKKAGISLKDVDKKMKQIRDQRDKHNPFLKGMNKATRQAVKNTLLKLDSNYINYGQGYDVARYNMWHDVCFLSGMIKGGGGKITKLPPSCRPMGGNIVFLQLKDNEPVRIDVLSNGDVIDHTKQQGWVSLNGITFFTKNGTNVFLTNGWDAKGGKFRTPFIKRYGDVCMLSGLLRATSKWGQVGEVSKKCRPHWDIHMDAVDKAKPIRVELGRNGSLYAIPPANPKTTKWLGLDGLIWMANKGNELPLLNGAKVRKAAESQRPSYWRVGNMVIVTGVVQMGPRSTHIATLPPGYRPLKRVVFDTAHNRDITRIDVLKNGKIIFVDFPKHKYVTLSGINFYVPRNDKKKHKHEEWVISRDDAHRKGKKHNLGDGMMMDKSGDSFDQQEFNKAKQELMKVAQQYNEGIKKLP